MISVLLLLQFFPAAETGSSRYEPSCAQSALPERYRLDARTFDYRLERKHELPACGVVIDRLTFASPVESPHRENNTVHAEYYRPKAPGKYPATVVLDITGG